MFCTSSIIDNLKKDQSIEFKRLCRLLKLTKKSEKTKLEIALNALEKLEIIGKNDKNQFFNIDSQTHIKAKIRCSSKGFCFAVREDSSEDIYIKENLLNYAWNGDKVLVRILKEGIKRRSPEGIVDCILERTNKILLAKIQIIDGEVYGIPIDDRILSKIKLPKNNKKFLYDPKLKNIVKIQIDMFPIAQPDGLGHVISELRLNVDEESDNDFVLSKNNLNLIDKTKEIKIIEPEIKDRLDLTAERCFMLKSWEKDKSPLMPIFHIDYSDRDNTKVWLHANSIVERIDFNDKNIIEVFIENFESIPLINSWKNFLDNKLCELSQFEINKPNKAISLCITISNKHEIKDWSFHLTNVTCKLIVDNNHLEALLNRKSKTRITSKTLKPIKDFIEDIDYLVELSKSLRQRYLSMGRFEIAKEDNEINSISEFFINNPSDYTNEYYEPFNSNDIQTYLSPLVLIADWIWFEHSKNFNLVNASYHFKDLNYINVNEIIKQTQILNSNFELDEDGTVSLSKLFNYCEDTNKKRIINKNLSNILNLNKAEIFKNNENKNLSENISYSVSPWTFPSFNYINFINQYTIYNLFRTGKRSYKDLKEVNIFKKDSWKLVNWKLLNASSLKITNRLFDPIMIDKYNDYKDRSKLYCSNIINIKKIREAEKYINKVFKGLIITVQSYGFFVELPNIFIEGLVHVSTLNDDWYEYRSRQNLLVGRKSKNTFSVGDLIDVKILKVDILKYQVDLEIV
tara:strand:+ start:6050 stop:8275 length:2226 start_codon:yes stop_codon:yes gene_type:complete